MPAQIASTSTINVDFSGFASNFQARTAFEYAVNIWETLIKSPVTIEVEASFTPMNSGVLAEAGPINRFRNVSNEPVSNTWYPSALANSLANRDLDTSQGDIFVDLNSDLGNEWYFGTDGNTPAGKVDFTQTVLHELAHGLGLIKSLNYSLGEGSWGFNGFPYIYDRFIENAAGEHLIGFPNSSVALGNQLTSNNLFFDGLEANAANAGRPKLFAPSYWEGGSSLSHLDEGTYNNSINALMTPYINDDAAAKLQIGPIVFGMFQDMGWKMNTEGWMYGTPGKNSLLGTSAAQNIYGLQGSDILKGGAGDDFISGGAGNDRLDGGTDDDDLYGGSGNDTYIVADFFDTVTETANRGTDTVKSATFRTLGDNLENLILTGNALSGRGNSLNNKLIGNRNFNILNGNGGNDTLYGGAGYDSLTGGLGNDRLVGGTGADTLTGNYGQDYFVFKAKTERSDTITDFSVVNDTIWVSEAGFGGGLAADGPVTTAQFSLGAGARDADDRLIYNQSTGALSFDSDGKGGLGQVQFARLSPNLAMTHNDIVVIA